MITFNVRVVGREGMLEPMRKRMEQLTLLLSDEQIRARAEELCTTLAKEFKCQNHGSGLDPVFVFEGVKLEKKLPKPEVKYSVEKKPKKTRKKSPDKKPKSGITGGVGLLF